MTPQGLLKSMHDVLSEDLQLRREIWVYIGEAVFTCRSWRKEFEAVSIAA